MDTSALLKAIDTYVKPSYFPLSVAVTKEEKTPDKMKRPLRDLGKKFAICQAFAVARRYGWAIALTKEDISCPPAKLAFGLEPSLPYYEEGTICVGLYTKDKEAGKRCEEVVPRFPFNDIKQILMAPLGRETFTTQVVVFYGNSAQVMRLLNGRLYRDGGGLTAQINGRIDCADLVIRTIQTDECQVVLPCYGDRMFGQTQDWEMAFSIPASKADLVIEGLEGTHKGGTRYPIPSFLRYEAEFPPLYMEMEKMWKEKS
jgi:uncharacterized protein (DUF169 family)